MSSQPLILRQCFQEAASGARDALSRCIEHSVTELQQAESKSMKMAERDEFAAAWRGLQKHKNAWCDQYAGKLLTAFDAPAPVSANALAYSLTTARSALASERSGFAELSLVDDSELSQAIESSRLLQRVLPSVEQPLSQLDALISSAMGLEAVSPELNPMRPEVFAQTLRGVVASVPTEPAISAMWMKHLAEPLGPELAKIYGRVIGVLEAAHVQAAGYRVLQTAGKGADGAASTRSGDLNAAETGNTARGALGAAGGNRGDGTGQRSREAPLSDDDAPIASDDIPYADLSNYEIGDALFQDFLHHGGSNAQHRLAPSYYEQVESELAQLKAAPDAVDSTRSQALTAQAEAQYQSLPAVDRPARLVDVLSQLSSQLWGVYGRAKDRAVLRTELKKDATRVGQVLGLEVVRKLVNQVAQDPRLLAPVREAIVALEPSLLRLAMVDPRFFSDERHAGRLIMERVAQRSFKYNDEFAPEFQGFFEPVRDAFNALNQQTEITSPEPFSMALAELQHLWSTEDNQEAAQREDAVKAMRFAEQRQATADQIAYDLSTRSDLDKVPGVVLDFLYGPWALVMATAKLTDTRNQIDPKGYGSVVSNLVWSSKLDFTLNQPAKLIEMIPTLLKQLTEGLDSLGQDPAERQTFFGALEQLHRPVLELRRATRERIMEEMTRLMADPVVQPATPEQRVAKPAAQPWLAPSEVGSAGFDESPVSQPDELKDTVPMALPEPELSPQEQELAAQLKELSEMTGVPMAPAAAAAPAAAPAEPQVLDDQSAEDMMRSLHTGAWVDLSYKGQWLRAQLIWASAKGTLYMFESHGGQPHSMTRRSCEKLVRERLLRLVNTTGVVVQALDALARDDAEEALA